MVVEKYTRIGPSINVFPITLSIVQNNRNILAQRSYHVFRFSVRHGCIRENRIPCYTPILKEIIHRYGKEVRIIVAKYSYWRTKGNILPAIRKTQ